MTITTFFYKIDDYRIVISKFPNKLEKINNVITLITIIYEIVAYLSQIFANYF